MTTSNIAATWRERAALAEANADGCDEISTARGKPAVYRAVAAALRVCAGEFDEFLAQSGATVAGPLLSETERWQVEEARDLLSRWDRERNTPPIMSTERALADAVRGLLALVDQIAPRGSEED